ncbi:hypothetical protein I79_008953 [Cricetulus griseus]|uniref:Uncharacterized protein n=1 Tax=Cricetulus griseus TaxID=10029 RepID=G3HEG9_CRIGR|nr:hypothetical protein I79_008953 [Cricetulus griseus]
MSNPLFRSAVSVDFSSLDLTPLCNWVPGFSSVFSCECLLLLHQLLDEGSRMTYKVLINLIIGEELLR